MRTVANERDDPRRKFLRYFDENAPAGKMLRRLISHFGEERGRSAFLQNLAEYARCYVLEGPRLNQGRQRRKELEQRHLRADLGYHRELAGQYRSANLPIEAIRAARLGDDSKRLLGKLKEAFDTQRLGRKTNHLPLIALREYVYSSTGARLQPHELAWILEAGYCAWERDGFRDVDSELLRKALANFEKRNPTMMTLVAKHFAPPDGNKSS